MPGKITICSAFPDDIPGENGAQGASLQDAAKFAWQEFIALNWPAMAGVRDMPDDQEKFGAPTYSGPLVWHTFRGKVEIYPGMYAPGDKYFGSPPPGYIDSAAKDYGYDTGPAYKYDIDIPPAAGITPPKTPPWINLDENSQIFLDQMFAGVVTEHRRQNDDQILFMAKANRAEYKYIAKNRWWGGAAPFVKTQNYISNKRADPPQGSEDYVSFPTGTVEVKASWRKLAPTEDRRRFYIAKVRYYICADRDSTVCANDASKIRYVDEDMALVGLHIIHKTKTAPHFIYATFEQADNLTCPDGSRLEDREGRADPAATCAPKQFMTPEIVSRNAPTSSSIPWQTFDPIPRFPLYTEKQLYYLNTPYTGIPVKQNADGSQQPAVIRVNKRKHAIPNDIIAVNQLAHDQIDSYTSGKIGTLPAGSVWRYYKLVNVQARLIPEKTPGKDYTGSDAATYYQSNSTIETDYNLQVFSGKFFAAFDGNDPHKFTITDFDRSGKAISNVAYNGALTNMGGCMGCHGNAQMGGSGFSFILAGGRTGAPDVVGAPVTTEQVERFVRYFGGK
ncbi:hypothetical protein C0Z17_11535 [Trinickia caryophylli]|nr:hypothetical protein C0Z17_11535 [Trinickia caryophylli]